VDGGDVAALEEAPEVDLVPHPARAMTAPIVATATMPRLDLVTRYPFCLVLRKTRRNISDTECPVCAGLARHQAKPEDAT